MQKCLCDICGIEEPQHNYKIKERELLWAGDNMPLIRWKRIDICDACFKNLGKLKYEIDLEKRAIDQVWNRYGNLYPDDIDLQGAYLQGAQDVMDMLLQNKVVKQR